MKPTLTQEAKDAIFRYVEAESEHRCEDAVNSLNGLKNLIESFPVSDGWIHITDGKLSESQLPKESQTVIAEWCNGIYEVVTKETTEDGYHVFRLGKSHDTYGVHNFVRWQPLPPTSHK